MSAPIFEYDLTILEHHLDTFGHVNNATYLQILEEARWDIITGRGYGLQKIMRSGLGPVILDVYLKFLKELRLRQRIKIKSQSEPYSGKTGIIRQWIENESGQRCCEAEFTFGLFDTHARKLVNPTPEWLYAVGLADSPSDR